MSRHKIWLLSGSALVVALACAVASYAQLETPRPAGTTCTPGKIRGMVDCRGAVVGTSCNGDDENQKPVFTLEEGAVLKNVTLSPAAADGIHCLGNCILENVVWQDVCEDAATMEGGPGTTMFIIGGSASNANDKVFQHNGIGSTVEIMNFSTSGPIGKLYRSCGDCKGNGGPRRVNITNVKLEKVTSAVAGVNSNFGDVARLRGVQIKDFKAGKPKICQEFRGVVKGNGSSQSIGEAFESASCDVRMSDVSGF